MKLTLMLMLVHRNEAQLDPARTGETRSALKSLVGLAGRK